MGTFRGIICNNDSDYNQKERLIQSILEKFSDYTSDFFAGGRGVPDLRDVNGNPILVEPKKEAWINEMPKLPLNFQDLDESIIERYEDI